MRTVPLLGLIAACNGGGDATPAKAPTYWHDVQPILAGRCVQCHTDGGIGTFPLTGYADVKAVGEVVANEVEARLMPPWKAVGGPAYTNDPSLTDDQIATIRAWVDGGMPEGHPADAGEPVPSLAVALPRVDATLSVPEPYSPRIDPDDYRCFPLAWDQPGTSYVTGFEVHPGNSTIVHHVAAFLIRPDGIAGPGVVDTFREWDASEDGPGYTCFGGPSKTGESLDVPIQQVAQWIPGEGGVLFPDGVGIPVVEGSLIVLQMHYNSAGSDGQPDQTTLDLMTEPDVERIGAFAPWLSAAWTFPGGMEIGAASSRTVTAEGDPLAFFGLLLENIDLSNGFRIHGGMLHMHTLGQHAEVHAIQGGANVPLIAVDPWDFNWQLTYDLAQPVEFAPGDELSLSCTFDNPGDAPVGWGEGTGDEMCVANLFVSAPK
jgi:hypothetical protein